MPNTAASRHQQGFTLVELSIVLIIVALLTGGLLLGVSAQRSNAEYADAQRQLENIREALIGFAMTNGRLPCPAPRGLASTNETAGLELPPPCDDKQSPPDDLRFGVLPWKTLGLPETDPWGRRFTYFVSPKFSGAVLSGSQSSFTLNAGIKTANNDDTATLAEIKDVLGSKTVIAAAVPAVVVSHGKNGLGAWLSDGTQVAGAVDNELENANRTQTFISRTPDEKFDDQVIWIVPAILKSKMVAAGRLP